MLRDIDQVESVVRDLMELANPGDLRLAAGGLNDVVRDALDQVAHQLAYRKIVVQQSLDRASARRYRSIAPASSRRCST